MRHVATSLILAFTVACASHLEKGVQRKPVFNQYLSRTFAQVERMFGPPTLSTSFRAGDDETLDELRKPLRKTLKPDTLVRELLYRKQGATVFIWLVERRGRFKVVRDAFVPDGIVF